MNKIWALLSIDNLYDQPENNLVAWWSQKPDLQQIQAVLHYDKEYILPILDGTTVRLSETDYRLEELSEGVIK
jgi:hypothetical protein